MQERSSKTRMEEIKRRREGRGGGERGRGEGEGGRRRGGGERGGGEGEAGLTEGCMGVSAMDEGLSNRPMRVCDSNDFPTLTGGNHH